MAVKERVGLVVSDKMDKTVVVAVENRAPHPKYRKIVVRTKRYKVHDEENKCQVGDRVRIQETRPLSRTKRWVVVDIITDSHTDQSASGANNQPQPVNQSALGDQGGEK
jgi:small subunit ribosomal protein S17